MKQEVFEKLLKELDGNSLETLTKKNAKYAAGADRLHNFKAGADILGSTTAMACWGYLTKHLVALRDMVERNDFSDRDDFLEKCQDSINYIRFLWCIGNEEYFEEAGKQLEEATEELRKVASVNETISKGYGYKCCFFENHEQADDLLDRMETYIDNHGFVTVADMYEMLGLCDSYMDSKYGWADLKKARIVDLGTKFAIDFPPVKLIDELWNNKEKEND